VSTSLLDREISPIYRGIFSEIYMNNYFNFYALEIDLYVNDDLFVPSSDRGTRPCDPATSEAREKLLNEGCDTLRHHLPRAVLPSFILTSRQSANVPENNGFCSLTAARNDTHQSARNSASSNAFVSRGEAIARSIAARSNPSWIIVENINTPMPHTLHHHTIFFGNYEDLYDPIFRSYLKNSLGRLCHFLLTARGYARGRTRRSEISSGLLQNWQ